MSLCDLDKGSWARGSLPAARKLWPLSIECKSRKAIAVYKDYEQAKSNCPEGAEPLVVIKQNRSKPLVIVDAEWFFERVSDGN